MNLEAKKEKYRNLCHAMQSGVAFAMEKDSHQVDPKHLRVGVNAAMVEHGALAGLLIKKGIITEDEYFDAMIEMMEEEVEHYKAILKMLYGQGRDINIDIK